MMVCNAFGEVILLAARLGVEGINKIPGCWEYQIDEQWWIAVNGHHEPTKCSHGPSVAPQSVYVEFNGWPAGSFDSGGGVIAAGEAANEETFLEALRKASSEAAKATAYKPAEGAP